MTPRKKILLIISLFNGLTATAGGIGLIAGFISIPKNLLNHTIFDSFMIPGLILAIVVGGSSLLASSALLTHKYYSRDLAGFAGLVMILWILSEVVLIREFMWLHGLYFITGYTASALARPSTKEFNIFKGHMRRKQV